MKDKPSKLERGQLHREHNHVYFVLLAYQFKKISKKWQESECWVVTWSSINEDSEDKK